MSVGIAILFSETIQILLFQVEIQVAQRSAELKSQLHEVICLIALN